MRGVVRAVLAGQDLQPHRRDRLDRESIPESPEKCVQVGAIGISWVIAFEHLAEQGLNHGDLDQGQGRCAAARDDRRHPVGPCFLAARHRLDQPGRITEAESGPGPKRSAAVKS